MAGRDCGVQAVVEVEVKWRWRRKGERRNRSGRREDEVWERGRRECDQERLRVGRGEFLVLFDDGKRRKRFLAGAREVWIFAPLPTLPTHPFTTRALPFFPTSFLPSCMLKDGNPAPRSLLPPSPLKNKTSTLYCSKYLPIADSSHFCILEASRVISLPLNCHRY
jgi:hypothetical protein